MQTGARSGARTIMLTVRSNIENLSAAAPSGVQIESFDGSDWSGVRAAWRQYRRCQEADCVLVDGDVKILRSLCALAWVFPKRFKLVVADIVLSHPKTLAARFNAWLWRLMLQRVDHFIVHQRDLDGYAKYYGVSAARSTYVPFKVNVWDDVQKGAVTTRDEGYFQCVGRTNRDLPTFIKACEISGVPAMLLRPSAHEAIQHGTKVPEDARPANLKEVIHNHGRSSWLEVIAGARAIVLPIAADAINAAGISTMLDGMALGKPIIIADSPATRGVVTEEQVALYPAGDAPALAAAMHRLHHDDDYRNKLVLAGLRYAAETQGEMRLNRNVLEVLISVVGTNPAAQSRPESGPVRQN